MTSEPGQDETSKRITQGREASQLLKNPLVESFFTKHLLACQQAFCSLPMGCTIEQYQTVHHDLLAVERLRVSLMTYVTRAETDIFDRKRQDDLPEDVEV